MFAWDAGPKLSKSKNADLFIKGVSVLANGLRTYRPKLDQYVFCSADVKERVLSWVRGVPEGQVSRNLMITGGSGLGKTTLGIAVCQSLGAHPNDIQEINCASMRTLEDARNLVDTLNFSPVRGKYRVLILDECHQMVSNAQQAFLTPLEQLPASTIVVACTSNPEQLLPTFKRRFYEIKLSDYDEDAMIEILSGLPAELKPVTIATIVEVASGNPGRAIALAESNAYATEGQESPLLQEILVVENFFQALVENNTKKLFLYSQAVKDENRKLFFDKMLRYLEASWMVSAGLNPALSSKELLLIQTQVERLVWQGAVDLSAKRMGFFSTLYAEFLSLSEKPTAHLKAWAMKTPRG
jgi:DNA polymerase III delta prime subunit